MMYLINREHVIREFNEYSGHYNADDPKIRLKIRHTFRVADISARIAESLDLPPDDRELAWLIGMLHDIGRFEQVRRYNTFVDAVSVNHAYLSADILFSEELIKRFLKTVDEGIKDEGIKDVDPADSASVKLNIRDMPLIEKAVRLHNILNLPGDLSERELLFCQIIRDADKVDILHIMCETPFEDIYDVTWDEFLNSDISPEVYEDIMAGRTVDRAYTRTPMDHRIGHIAFVNGLVYPESRKIIREQGTLQELLNIYSTKPETKAKLLKIKEYFDRTSFS